MRNSGYYLPAPEGQCGAELPIQRCQIEGIDDDLPRRIRSQPAGLDYYVWQSDGMPEVDAPPRPAAHTPHLLEKCFLALHGLLEWVSDVVFDTIAILADKATSGSVAKSS